ncbi:MAG: RNA 3'-terminal phosphate cyclase [Planctomycetes bacterium]|nr:RNA 3'-terminal phosphate cyclase [Planctomycetota bacterium]
MLIVDGAQGEGGGQIVRSSLALALVSGVAVTIDNIRARRARPGLMRQHLTAVQAAAEISGAEVRGADIGSRQLIFRPGPVRSGEYHFRIGTAGSTTLVLQTVLPALMLAEGVSAVTLEGGTHNPLAPPYDFLARVYLPLLARLGPRVDPRLERAGFYPAGGGRFSVTIHPSNQLDRLELLDRGDIVARKVRAMVANLPRHIAERECRVIAERSRWDRKCFHVEERNDSPGPGNVVLIEIDSQNASELVAAFGQKGVRAERVAQDAWRETRRYLEANVPVGEHLADQLLLPLGISAWQGRGGGAFRTLPLSQHALTHIEVLKLFLDVQVEIASDADGNITVSVS